MDIVYKSLAKVEEVTALSTAACRIFYTVERLEGSNQFDAELYTKSFLKVLRRESRYCEIQ